MENPVIEAPVSLYLVTIGLRQIDCVLPQGFPLVGDAVNHGQCYAVLLQARMQQIEERAPVLLGHRLNDSNRAHGSGLPDCVGQAERGIVEGVFAHPCQTAMRKTLIFRFVGEQVYRSVCPCCKVQIPDIAVAVIDDKFAQPPPHMG